MRRNHPTSGIFTDNNIHHIVGTTSTIRGRSGFRVELINETDYDNLPDAIWVWTHEGEMCAQVLGYDVDGWPVVGEPGGADLREPVQIRG